LEASFRVDVDVLLTDDGSFFISEGYAHIQTAAAVITNQVERSGINNDALDVNSMQQNEIISLLIPPKPDFIPNQNVHKAIATPNGTTPTSFIHNETSCNITSRVQLRVVNRSNAANTRIFQQWTLETIDEHGNIKHVGGDEFYATYSTVPL
jgi:hypothetical protein